jgi:hypothetical protein
MTVCAFSLLFICFGFGVFQMLPVVRKEEEETELQPLLEKEEKTELQPLLP